MSGPRRVLIVDGDDRIRSLLRLLFDRIDGLEVVGEAADGHQAISACADLAPDLVVLDNAMPRLDGLAALRLIGEVSPGSDVIVWTAYLTPQLRDAALDLGAYACADKWGGVQAITAATCSWLATTRPR